MTNQTRITLKNVKHAAFASEETHCYSASVYFDNKRVGTVKNDGHGGADYEYIEDRDGWKKMSEFIETLPATKTDLPDHNDPTKKWMMEESLESICCDLVNDFLVGRDLKRELSKKVLFRKTNSSAVFETKPARNKATLNHWIEQIADRADTDDVLNLMPFEQAREIYRAI